MKILYVLFNLFFTTAALNIKSAQQDELVNIESWAGFQGLNVLSVGAVANDCKTIFDSCRADTQKVIDDLLKVVQNTEDASIVPPKLWEALGRITDILQNGPKNVRFHFAELGDHFMKKLNGVITAAQSKKSDKLSELQNIYNSEVDTTNESVLELEKSFSINYNPNSILQQAVPDSLKQDSYSQSVAMYELKHLSSAVKEEIDSIERSALQLLNKIYRGITMVKEVQISLKKTAAYPTKYDEQYIKDNLQNCSYLAKALKPENHVGTTTGGASQPVSNAPVEPEIDGDPVIPSLADETPNGDNSGCGEIFRKTEKKIMQQLVITIKEIKTVNDNKEIDSRTFQIFKNYSLILSNLNKKIITNVITFVNQFFQLYNIVLSILDKINPDMKAKAEDLLYLKDVDTSDSSYENINKYVVDDYLSSSRMNELFQKIDNHVKSMKSLSEIKKGIIQELSVVTNEIGVDLQTMKDTIIYVFEEIKKGVKALQNLKNKSNRTGFRYYLNFYRGKADLAQLKKLICIINSLNIDLLLERQLFSDDDELQALKSATSDTQNEIDQKNQKNLDELNGMNDFNFVQGFVSRSVLDYNMCLESYCVESRTILKKVITKYVTVFEELLIIIKRKKIKNAKTIEDLYLNKMSVSNNQDEIVSRYLLEKTDIDIEKLCSTLNQERDIENKETVDKELRELSTVSHSEVNKISQTVQNLISTMSTEIHNLKSINEQASQNINYEITDDKLKCISNIIQIIDSLHIKSNKDEIQNLSIYFERVKESIQMSTQTFETKTSECVEIQQFKSEVETLKTSIYEALTKASSEINEKIRRVIFEYNEKLYILQQNTSYCEINNSNVQDSSYILNDYTKKYVTGYYTSDEIFKTLDGVMSTASTSDISQLKTDMYTKLDETNQNIESELEKIHDDLNVFVEKFSDGMKVLTDIETTFLKQTDQQTEVIDESQLSIIKEVNGMVKIVGKYVNVNAENSQRELRVQIDNARLQITKQFDQVTQTVTSTQDNAEIESVIMESISTAETLFNELKNNTRSELSQSIEEFLTSYQNTITSLQTQTSNSQSTFMQDLNKGDCKSNGDDFQKFVQIMLQQDYSSTSTVSSNYEYMKRYNFVNSQNIKEKYSQIFQSLSNKMNIEIDSVSHTSKYVLENIQRANNVLIKLENCGNKQSMNVSLTEEELAIFRTARSISDSWKYCVEDNTFKSIGSTITTAKMEIDVEYRKLQTNTESTTTTQNTIESEITNSLQIIQNIFQSTQTTVNEMIKQNVENFYSSMSNEVNELQSSGSTTLNSSLQTLISGRSVSSTNIQQNSNSKIDFDSFKNSVNVQEIYNQIKTKTSQNSNIIIENFKQTMNEKFSSVEKTSAYVIENVQKGYSIINEIKTSLQIDSNYQLTQYEEEQLRKCVSVSRKIGNLSVDAKTAQQTVTNSINSVRNQIKEEYTKVTDSVASLTDEKSIQEAVSKGVSKFEQLFSQVKDTVREQLSLTSSSAYSSFMKTISNLEQLNSNEVCKTMRDIENDTNSYQSDSDQYYKDAVSYFTSSNFKSCLSIKNWFNEIHSTTLAETYSTINERTNSELSSLNDKISNSFEKMESSSTYVFESIEKSTEVLKQIEESVKQDVSYQLTEDQIIELQKCMSVHKSIQVVTSISTASAEESIHNDINGVKNKIKVAHSELTQSLSSLSDEHSISEVTSRGIKTYETLYTQAKETVKEQLSQTLNSFFTSFTQTFTDSRVENTEISTTFEQIKSGASSFQCDDQSFHETVSFFNSEAFKSCISVKNWFNEFSTSSSTNNLKEKAINNINQVDEKVNNSLETMITSSSFIFQSIEKSSEVFKQIQNSLVQQTTIQLNEEQIVVLKKSMSIYQNMQSIVASSSTSVTQQTILSDITNTKEEISNAYSQITQSISSQTEDNSIKQVENKGVEKFEKLFSHATEQVKEQLFHKSSDFHSMFTQLSSDLHQENLQTVVTSENESQTEIDQSFSSMLSCFNSDIYKSPSVVKSWYSEIQKSTTASDWSYFSDKVTNEFSTLNDRVTKSLDSVQESSTYALTAMKKGFEVIKQVKELMIEDSNYKLTQEQVTFLQKCVTIHQTIQSIMTTSSSTVIKETKQTVESNITDMKSQINDEFAKASQTISSSTDESSINHTVTESVDNMDKLFSHTKQEVQSLLSNTVSDFYSTYQKISSMSDKQEIKEVTELLSNTMNNKNLSQYQNDESFNKMMSYFTDKTYKSSSMIQNLYNEITSSSATTESSNLAENAINKLNTLNERVSKSIESMEENSSYVIDTIGKGSEILKKIEESTTQNSAHQLNQEQITYLQKCISIYQTIQTITTTTTSKTTTSVKQTISSNIETVKNQVTNEFSKVLESLKSLDDETSIKKVVDESVNEVDKCFNETREKLHTELTQSSTDFFNNYQQITSMLDKQDLNNLQDITTGKTTYQADSDAMYSKAITYFTSDTFKSSAQVQSWYKEIQSNNISNQSKLNENVINQMGTLQDRVTKSIDSMGEYSSNILDTIEKGSDVIKQIRSSTEQNSNCHLTQCQIIELQKSISIYNVIKSISIANNCSTTINKEQNSVTKISDVKNQINDEYMKVSETLRSLSDETSIKQVVDENVSKVEQYYGQARKEVQSEMAKTSTDFFSNLQNFSSNVNTQSNIETNTQIKDIMEGKRVCQEEHDESFNKIVKFMNSDSFKSDKVIQEVYQNIQSEASISTSTNCSEHAINNLGTLNKNVTKCVDEMEENSKYALDIIKKGDEVLHTIEECTKQDSNYKITQDQIVILRKCITIYQIIQSVTTTTTTTDTRTTISKDEKASETGENVSQKNDADNASVVSNIGRSIVDAFGVNSEDDSKLTDHSETEQSKSAEHHELTETGALNNEACSSNSTTQSSKNTGEMNSDDDIEKCTSVSISNTQQKINSDVSNVKTQINDEYSITSQSINSLSDETSIKHAVDQSVQKVDHYYSEAKKEVQTQLTQTTSSFFNTCQKISKNSNKDENGGTNSALREILDDKKGYQPEEDDSFKEVVSYLNSDSFKASSDVQNWYNEIHSGNTVHGSTNLNEQSVNELGNLNSRVAESMDKMENHTKYILDTMKQGSEILEEMEESSRQNTNHQLTQSQIIILKKCITIYQIIETITTTTTVTNTVSVKNNSVTNKSLSADDDYEYEITATKNTKEVVEESTQEVKIDEKDAANSSTWSVNDEKKSCDNSAATSVLNVEQEVSHENISKTPSDSPLDNSIKQDTMSQDASSTKAVENSMSHDSVQKTSTDVSASQNAQSTTSNATLSGNKLSESNVISSENTSSNKNGQDSTSKPSRVNKVELLKKFTQDQTSYSKTSLTSLMMNWTITKSTTAGIPNTCNSLVWEKYFVKDEDESIIKEIADLLAVGRSVIEDSITLKKEKLPLYRDIDEIEMMVVSCAEIVDEILLQISEVVGQDVQALKFSFSELSQKSLDSATSNALVDKTSTLDKEFLSAASTFFSMKDSKKTDLLNQINRQFNFIHIEDEKKAKEVASQKFDKLQEIMKTVLDNIDCLVLRTVDVIENARHSLNCLKNNPQQENAYICVKNGQVFCDAVKFPSS